jgi:AraC family transcriptional regulator, regulatory protein of adaptative response / methylated-DNA-[protein]-cysteine methyltransferase
MTPQFSNTPEPETLRFGYGDTALGMVLIAESTLGVVALFIGDEHNKLGLELREAFPEAKLLRDDTGLAETIAKAVALVAAPHLGTNLPLDLRGSPIEVAVWQALRTVPAGETRTYGAIARDLPITATAQEVGAACAANKIAVAVPCHRVVKSDGSIAGYRWGVRRKRRLINMEGVA